MSRTEYSCKARWVPLLGRILIGAIFFFSGIAKIFGFHEAVQMLESSGVQMGPQVLLGIAIFLEIVGSLLIILGLFTRIGALMLLIFLIPVTLTMHAFWNFQGMEQATQVANFAKNVAIFGGLLILFEYGPGCWSIDACFKKM